MTLYRLLLIEPVWNRNKLWKEYASDRKHTFNRTSLESKLCQLSACRGDVRAFNRTSLESKHQGFASGIQLIRSFNRTSLESKHCGAARLSKFARELLIEPVWNRNNSPSFRASLSVNTFNRTSLESKPGSHIYHR